MLHSDWADATTRGTAATFSGDSKLFVGVWRACKHRGREQEGAGKESENSGQGRCERWGVSVSGTAKRTAQSRIHQYCTKSVRCRRDPNAARRGEGPTPHRTAPPGGSDRTSASKDGVRGGTATSGTGCLRGTQ